MAAPIDLRYIFKRGRFLEKRKSITESTASFNIDYENINSPLFSRNVYNYIRECTSYKDAIKVLETLYENNKFDILENTAQTVINAIVPLTENEHLKDLIEVASNANIGEINRDRIIEAANIYKVVDRIINNHKSISKRFCMDSLFGKSNREKCFRISEMVNTYSTKLIPKVNIAIEEMSYLNLLNGFNIPEDEIVKNVLEYFMMVKDATKDGWLGIIGIGEYFVNIAKDSKILHEGCLNKVNRFTNNTDIGWKYHLNEWLIDQDKSVDGLISIIKENYDNVEALNTLIDYVNEFTYINDIEFDPINIFKEFSAINAEEAINIESIIKENNISNTDDLIVNLRAIWEAEINDSVYDDGTVEPETFTSDKIDKFKMYNMVTDAQTVGEFLDHLEKTSAKESPIEIKRILSDASDKNITESNAINYIDSNGYITMRLRSYRTFGNVNEVKNLVENSVKCINNILYNRDSSAFYTIYENGFEISIRSKYKVFLTEQQERYRGFSDSDKSTIVNINKYTEALSKVADNDKLSSIIEILENDKDYAASVSLDEVVLIQEMLNPFIDRNNSIINNFIDNCISEANPNSDGMKEACESIEEESFDPYADNISRINLCYDMIINESKYKKYDDDEEDNEDDDSDDENSQKSNNRAIKNSNKSFSNDDISNEKKKKQASINNIKLAWHGVKSKFKKASAKEQEICRDMDIDFNHLVQTITSNSPDRRREIITGEVNYSLSRALKKAITLAGIGILAGNALVPILGAVMMFVRSKHTSYKEKRMILDEIDIELKIVERELNRADTNGSNKKYRQLLTIQRNLQRKRQEIQYNLIRKGKRIPVSPVKTGDD